MQGLAINKESNLNKIITILTSSLLFTSAMAQNLGEATYQVACSNCHAPKLSKSILAPAAFDKKAWKIRFKKAKLESKMHPELYPTPMDYLLNSVINGKKLMHHGGLCHESNVPKKYCSKEAFIQAIEYMKKS